MAMRLTTRVQGTAETDVIGAFKRYGLALIAIPAVLVAIVVGYVVHDVIVRDFGEVFAAGMQGTVSEAWNADDFVVDTNSDQFRHFDEMIDERVAGGRVTAVRVQLLDGTVVYSTRDEELGTVVPLDDTTRGATQGKVTAFTTASHSLLLEDGDSNLLVVGPVMFGDAGQIAGVFTALKPYSTVRPSIRVSVLTVVFVIFTGALVTYTFLRLLVARAERELNASRERVQHVNERLGSSLNEMERHFLGTLKALNAAVDAKDRYTARHSLHVADYACALGLRLGMGDQVKVIERAGLLHDIGKIGVPEAVLQKSTSLTAEEYLAVQEHSRIGATMIETVPFLRDIVPAVQSHHEWWDGSGYPDALAGEEIPRLGRVLSVVDAFDAMTTSRPYRDAISVSEAREEIIRFKGTQFDPEMVDAFVELIDERAIIVPEARAWS